ncbi:MAG: alpha/beta fold hydrolase [Mycobacteriales bacterium]
MVTDLLTSAATRRLLRVPATLPELPSGQLVELPGRGTTFVVDVPGPKGAPTLLLLHSLGCTSLLTWFTAIAPLRERFRLVMLDQRGHGRGISDGRFSLEDCADDAIALCDVLGLDQVISVGYSMGGPIALLTWHRYPHRVAGLVLCATARNFRGTPKERVFFQVLPAILGRLPGRAAGAIPAPRPPEPGPGIADLGVSRWALAEFRATPAAMMLQGVAAIGAFTCHDWIGQLAVPTSVVVTTRDHLVPTRRQLKLAEAVPDAQAFFCHGSHATCVLGSERFVPVLVQACDSVAARLPSG